MTRTVHLILLAVGTALLLAFGWWLQSWGALALLFVGAVGWGWYRMQVARSAAAEQFFGDAGEETRLSVRGGLPSETPCARR